MLLSIALANDFYTIQKYLKQKTLPELNPRGFLYFNLFPITYTDQRALRYEAEPAFSATVFASFEASTCCNSSFEVIT
jgi:hypothetical protein